VKFGRPPGDQAGTQRHQPDDGQAADGKDRPVGHDPRAQLGAACHPDRRER
jgi:hypothetical protein